MLRSEHLIQPGLPSGPVPVRAGVPPPPGSAGPEPRRGNGAPMVRPPPGLVPSCATPARGPHAPPPIPWTGAPRGGAGVTLDCSFFVKTAMGSDDGCSNDDPESGGAAPDG